MSKPVSKVSDVRVPGPLAPFAAGFRSALFDAGYTPLSAVNQLRLMVHLSRWLDGRGLSVADLTEELVEAYLGSRRAAGYVELYSCRGLAPLLGFLAAQDAVAVQETASGGLAAEVLLAAFERYLLAERGLSAATISAYVSRATRFVGDYTVDGAVRRLTAGDVTRAVLDECGRVSVGSVQYFVAALRAFLRFCRVEGLIDDDLSAAALTVTGRRSSLLPKGISDRDATALLRSCDRRRATGRRDYAVLVVLLRLGLRAGEVAALRLADIDWAPDKSRCTANDSRKTGFPCPPMSVRRSSAICSADARAPTSGRCL